MALDDTVPSPKVETSQAPRSDVSGAAFARPDIGTGLQQLGAGLDELATPLAKIQGEQDAASAVTRNPDGSLTVTQHPAAPIFGKPGEAYQQAMETGIASGLRSNADVTLAQMATQYKNQPDAFRVAAGNFVDGLRTNNPGVVGDLTARYAQSVADQHDVGLVAQKQNDDLAATAAVNAARQTQLENQMDGLAAQGAIGSSAFLAAQKERDGLQAAKVANPAYDYSADQQKIDDANFQTRINVSTLTGVARDAAQKTGNVAAAMQELDQGLRQLPISETQRIAYEGEVTRHLSAMSAIGAQQRQAMSDQADVLRYKAAAHPDSVQPQEFDDMSLQLERSKMFNKSAEMQLAKIQATTISPMIVSGTIDQATAGLHQVQAMASGVGASGSEKQALDYFTSQGWTPAQASGIVGNLLRESGLRTGAANPGDGADGSTSIGIGQWNSTRAANLRAFAAQQGKPVSDFGTQLAFVQHELQTSESNAATMLRGAATPRDAAAAFALGYERPAGFMSGDINQVAGGADRVNNALRLAGGNVSNAPVPAVAGDGQTPIAVRYGMALIAAQDAYNGRASKLWDGMQSAYDANQMPTPTESRELRLMMPDITDVALRQKILDGTTKAQALQGFGTLPIAQQEDVAAAVKQAGQQGSLDNISRKIVQPMEAQVAQQVKLAKDDPVSLGMLKTPPIVAKQAGLPQLQQLDPSNPQAFSAGLQARQLWKNVAKADPSVGDMPLRSTDVTQLAAQAPNWTSGQAATALGGLAGLKPTELDAVMANKQMKDMVVGLAHSGDSQKMNAAYSLLDTVKRSNPVLFDAQNGNENKELTAWQSLISYLPADEVAKKMAAFNDPDQVKERDSLRTVAETSLKDMNAGNVVSKVFGSWIPFRTPGNVASDGAAPGEAGAGNALLLEDYRKAYIDQFQNTGSQKAAEDYANEKVGAKYSASAFSGGRVMAYAPDKTTTDPSGAGEVGAYYPKVNGSFDWLQKQLFSDVANSRFGHDFRLDNRNQTLPEIALLPDAKTQADIAAKRPPSYQVIARSPTDGRFHLIEGEVPGQAMRFRGDPASAQAEANDAFNAQRAANLGSNANEMPDNLD